MANEKWLKVIDYGAVRDAFDEEYKKTRNLIESGETHLDNLAEGFTEADRVLRKMLNVDAGKVVRCRDCKHRYNGVHCTHPQLLSWSWGAIREFKDDDFCSYGERKDGDGNG